jgi:hypothetical protein
MAPFSENARFAGLAMEHLDVFAAFMDKLEAANTARLAEKPEPMVIPLASMVLAKEGCQANA